MKPSYIPLFPDQASTMAGQVDLYYAFLIAVALFFTVLVAFLVLFFAIKYRKENNPVPTQIEGSIPLELLWSVIPLGISMVIFGWGAALFFQMQRPPKNAMDVYIIAKQWMWKAEHPTGQREINELHVPAGRNVRLTMISQDVIHDFFVPAFRMKQDVLPGRYSTAWFHATKVGRYHLFCAEYCGTKHSGMIGEVIVMEPADYADWLGGGAQGSLAQGGEKLFQSLGCSTCHRGDAGARGPNLAGLIGTPVKLSDGRTIIADEAYVRESVLNPSAKVVAGFQNIMPTFQGQVTEENLIQLVEYVKSLKGPQQQTQALTNTATPGAPPQHTQGPSMGTQVGPDKNAPSTVNNPEKQKQ